jgi:hypothetical protein
MGVFHPTREGDEFVVGRLDGDAFSGVYLSTAYLDRLREAMYAVSKRLDAVDPRFVPDAVLDVVGIANCLTRVHAEQLRVEGYPGTAADRAALAEAEAEIAKAIETLNLFDASSGGEGTPMRDESRTMVRDRSSAAFFEGISRLARALSELPAEILESSYHPGSFGSWYLLVRFKGRVARIAYDGRDAVTEIAWSRERKGPYLFEGASQTVRVSVDTFDQDFISAICKLVTSPA